MQCVEVTTSLEDRIHDDRSVRGESEIDRVVNVAKQIGAAKYQGREGHKADQFGQRLAPFNNAQNIRFPLFLVDNLKCSSTLLFLLIVIPRARHVRRMNPWRGCRRGVSAPADHL